MIGAPVLSLFLPFLPLSILQEVHGTEPGSQFFDFNPHNPAWCLPFVLTVAISSQRQFWVRKMARWESEAPLPQYLDPDPYPPLSILPPEFRNRESMVNISLKHSFGNLVCALLFNKQVLTLNYRHARNKLRPPKKCISTISMYAILQSQHKLVQYFEDVNVTCILECMHLSVYVSES